VRHLLLSFTTALTTLASLTHASVADELHLAAARTPVPAESPTTRFDPTTAVSVPVAIAVNSPLGWIDGNSVAGSFYVGLSRHLALRANVATYKHTGAAGAALAAVFGAEDEGSYSGRTTDVGIGTVYYSRGLWDGFTAELGANRRAKDAVRTSDENASPAVLTTNTQTYAARALIGWSWLIEKRVFFAVAAGASTGYETGRETSGGSDPRSMSTTVDVSRQSTALEGYLRIGGAFDF